VAEDSNEGGGRGRLPAIFRMCIGREQFGPAYLNECVMVGMVNWSSGQIGQRNVDKCMLVEWPY